jgi:ubiquitin-protein ligase E3 C
MLSDSSLSVSFTVPFVIPFESRVEVFRQFIRNDRERQRLNEFSPLHGQRATIRRTNAADDAFTHLSQLGPLLKGRLEITFVDQHGIVEAGIDGGGLFKELITRYYFHASHRFPIF